MGLIVTEVSRILVGCRKVNWVKAVLYGSLIATGIGSPAGAAVTVTGQYLDCTHRQYVADEEKTFSFSVTVDENGQFYSNGLVFSSKDLAASDAMKFVAKGKATFSDNLILFNGVYTAAGKRRSYDFRLKHDPANAEMFSAHWISELDGKPAQALCKRRLPLTASNQGASSAG